MSIDATRFSVDATLARPGGGGKGLLFAMKRVCNHRLIGWRHAVGEDKNNAAESPRDPTGTYAVVGELVMVASALDFQLTQIVIEACHLGQSPMIHSVIATLDPSRKVEVLKERSKAIPKSQKYRENLEIYCGLAEAVATQRNIACHSTPVLVDGNWIFKPMAAAKMLRSMRQGKEGSPARDFLEAIHKGERAFAVGVDLVENFSRLSAKLAEQRSSRDRLSETS